jgi:cellulose synthase/poly-beta-1,6-N-acetylglucosamine synthase-like glycosyltransferase
MVTRNPLAVRPAVSVIVPARNEEACLGTCLQSLKVQAGIGFEIIVVDDGSTDRTRQIAESFPGVRVIDAAPLPAGWSGKTNAMLTGARAAQGEWLLFTDADTVHLPGSLACAVAEAKQRGAALLSYSPAQEVHGFWEKSIMPVIFAELAATYRPSQVSNSASPAAAANGQYLLITREAYDAVGGHEAIASSLLEDVALARAVKASGRKVFFRLGADAVRTRMYRSFGELKEGWTKNLVLLFPSVPRLALLRLLEFVLIVGSAGLAVNSAIRAQGKPALVSGGIAVLLIILFLKRIRRAHFSWDANALSLLGLPLFSYLLLRSRIFHKGGRVTWKGRQYATDTTARVSDGQKLHERRQDAGARSWST